MKSPDYDYNDLIQGSPVKYSKVTIPDEGVWLKLEEGIEEDNVLFRFVEAKITDDGYLEFKLDTTPPDHSTDRLYEYAAKIITHDLQQALAQEQ